MQNDGDDIMVCIFTSKVVCPSSLTVCEHQESTFPSPTVVMHSISLEHDPPAERYNLIWDVVVVTDLRILDFLSIPFSCNQTSARSSLKLWWISMALIPTLFLPGAVRIVKKCHRHWWSQSLLLLIQNTGFLLRWWWQYFCHRQCVFQQ